MIAHTQRLAFAAGTGVLMAAAPLSLEAQYQAYKLGVGVNFFGHQSGMNATGWVAASNSAGALVYNPITGQIQQVNRLAANERANVFGINDAGQLIGQSGTRAARWNTDGTGVYLGAAGTSSLAQGINASGQVVGQVFSSRATQWSTSGSATTLSNTFSIAFDNNDIGQIIGYRQVNGTNRATRWNADGSATTLASFGGTFDFGLGVNASGQGVGYGRTSAGQDRAIFWSADGSSTNLGTLAGGTNSYAYGINAAGVAVGSSSGGQFGGAFIWDAVNGMQEISSYAGLSNSWRFSTAKSINDRGDILVYGQALDNSYTGWVVLHNTPPVPAPITAAPEPGTVALLATGLGALALVRRRRRA